eukprot:jgi/Botrbrau1/17044/Bobra.49_2s0100.1
MSPLPKVLLAQVNNMVPIFLYYSIATALLGGVQAEGVLSRTAELELPVQQLLDWASNPLALVPSLASWLTAPAPASLQAPDPHGPVPNSAAWPAPAPARSRAPLGLLPNMAASLPAPAPAASHAPGPAHPSSTPAPAGTPSNQPPVISDQVLEVLSAIASNFLCHGLFVQNRTVESVWAFEGCFVGCLAHQVFNLTNPEASVGVVTFGESNVTATIRKTSTTPYVSVTYRYLGPRFGCQLYDGKETVTPVYADDGVPASNFSWVEAGPNSPNAIPGLNYTALEGIVGGWFQDPAIQAAIDTRALLVVHKGKIVAEQYQEALGWGPSSRQISWSLAKSITSALVGMRIAEGGLKLSDVLKGPSWSPQEAASRHITVENLLQMKSGIDWAEVNTPTSDPIRLTFTEPDIAAFASSIPQAIPAGGPFNYSTGNYALLQYMLRESFKGNDTAYWSYPTNRLFKRIGAKSMLMDVDSVGTFQGGAVVYATPRDFARFGLLYLQDGVWEGERLVSHGWIKYSTTASSPVYAAGWWVNLFPVPSDAFIGEDFLGQRLVVIPSQDLLILHMGLGAKTDEEMNLILGPLFASISAIFPKEAGPNSAAG